MLLFSPSFSDFIYNAENSQSVCVQLLKVQILCVNSISVVLVITQMLKSGILEEELTFKIVSKMPAAAVEIFFFIV